MKRRRMWMALGLVAIVGALVLLVAGGLRENVVYFLTPPSWQPEGRRYTTHRSVWAAR